MSLGLGAGAAAGVIAATFVCPLDVINTRLQVHGLPQFANGRLKGSLIIGSLKQIIQKEGLCGMYHGLTPTVLALLPNWALNWAMAFKAVAVIITIVLYISFEVYFTMYDQFKSILSSDGGTVQASRTRPSL